MKVVNTETRRVKMSGIAILSYIVRTPDKMGHSPGAAGEVLGRGRATALHARRRQLQRDIDSRQRLWQRSGATVRLNRIRSRDP